MKSRRQTEPEDHAHVVPTRREVERLAQTFVAEPPTIYSAIRQELWLQQTHMAHLTGLSRDRYIRIDNGALNKHGEVTRPTTEEREAIRQAWDVVAALRGMPSPARRRLNLEVDDLSRQPGRPKAA